MFRWRKKTRGQLGVHVEDAVQLEGKVDPGEQRADVDPSPVNQETTEDPVVSEASLVDLATHDADDSLAGSALASEEPVDDVDPLDDPGHTDDPAQTDAPLVANDSIVDDPIVDDTVAEDAGVDDAHPDFTMHPVSAPAMWAGTQDPSIPQLANTTVSPSVVPVAAKTTHEKKRSRVLPIIAATFISVAGAAGLVVGCGAVGHAYFDDHAKPGAQLAGQDITGFSPSQVEGLAMTLMEGYQATLELDGREVSASPRQLGIDFDLDQTVADAMAAGESDEVTVAYNPFAAKNVPLAMDVDEDELQIYLNDTFISDDDRSVPADVIWDPEQQKFVLIPAVIGHQADAAEVADMLAEGEGYHGTLQVPTIEEPPLITDKAAQEVADAANAYASVPYVVRAGDRQYQIPLPAIASWMVLDSDPEAGTITWTIDAAKVTAEVPQMVEDNLTQAPVPTQYLIGPEGNTLGVQSDGSDGTRVADPAGVAATIVGALNAGTGLDLGVEVAVEPHAVENVPMAPEYLVPNGARWVEVNRSNFTVTRWEGTTKLSVWSVVIGRAATPTYAGIFHVWYMNPLQDMRGEDYLQPNVPWNAYFNNDIALHGNYWVGGFGYPASHGCVGMPPSLAEVMYHWINVGDLVVVHD